MPTTVLLIANRNAAGGSELQSQCRTLLSERGHSVEACTADTIEGCQRAVQSTSADVIAIAGGDGSIHCLLPALLEANKPMLLLPGGTANDFIRSLDLPLELAAAADLLEVAHYRDIDVGMVNDTPFLNVAHIGLASTARKDLRGGVKSRLGMLSYALSAVSAHIRHRSFAAKLKFSDGREETLRCTQLSIGNSGHFGGGWKLSPEVSPKDGELMVCNASPAGIRHRLAQLGLAVIGLQREHPKLQYFSTPALDVWTRDALTITADGEEVDATPARFSLQRAALKVCTPR